MSLSLIWEPRRCGRSLTLLRPTPSYITLPDVTKSVGAGDGSIAWVDHGDLLHVGSQSAGAAPGPVCYGRDGTQGTVTDACLVLRYLDPAYFLGGVIALRAAVQRGAVAERMGCASAPEQVYARLERALAEAVR